MLVSIEFKRSFLHFVPHRLHSNHVKKGSLYSQYGPATITAIINPFNVHMGCECCVKIDLKKILHHYQFYQLCKSVKTECRKDKEQIKYKQ